MSNTPVDDPFCYIGTNSSSCAYTFLTEWFLLISFPFSFFFFLKFAFLLDCPLAIMAVPFFVFTLIVFPCTSIEGGDALTDSSLFFFSF